MGNQLLKFCPTVLSDFYEEEGFDGTYEFDENNYLGTGKFAVVHVCWRRSQPEKRYALKVINTRVGDMACLNRIREEINILQVLGNHPGLVSLIDTDETLPGSIRLVLELCEGGELYDRIQQKQYYPEQEAKLCCFQLLEAVAFIHGRGIMHRDLKPENFLVDRGKAGDVLKLIDFGSSVQLSAPARPAGPEAQAPPDVGTLLYMSPQMLCGESASRADDVWSLGVIFHILLTGRFPFSTNDDGRFLELCTHGLLEHDVEDHVQSLRSSPAARDLAAKLLAFDPAKRITVQAALQHPFLRGAREDRMERLGAEELREHCERFAETCRLRRLALAVSARLAEASWADADRVRETFLALDRGDGSVDAADLRSFLSSAGLRVSAPWLTRLLRDSQVLSEPHGRAMSYTSFAAAAFEDAAVSGRDRVCQAVFQLLDADHDGVVSAEDLRRRLDLSLQESKEMIVDALSDIGLDSQRRSGIDFREFLQLMGPQCLPQPA
mmetsp:Transcript_163052/g.396193  ORF Transcript_163052/g.396193 Transcript_163052/m.396193 type:complete len:495 (-) Transcript_163052:113-1597(-)